MVPGCSPHLSLQVILTILFALEVFPSAAQPHISFESIIYEFFSFIVPSSVSISTP